MSDTSPDSDPNTDQDGLVKETPADQPPSGMSRPQQLFVVFIMGTTLCLVLVHYGRLQGWGMSEVTINRPEENKYDFKIEINKAGWVEWMQLEGIGQKKAHAITREREKNGPFTSIDNLIRVEGIGEKTLAKLRPWLLEPDSLTPPDTKSETPSE